MGITFKLLAKEYPEIFGGKIINPEEYWKKPKLPPRPDPGPMRRLPPEKRKLIKNWNILRKAYMPFKEGKLQNGELVKLNEIGLMLLKLISGRQY